MNDRHSVFGAMVSNLAMLTSLMVTRPSDQRCDTERDWASGFSALAGITAEKPPTMGSSCVMRPPLACTRRSAVSLEGLASRTMTCTCAPGSFAASETRLGSAICWRRVGVASGRAARIAAPIMKTASDNAIVRSSFVRRVAISAAVVLKVPVTSHRYPVLGIPRDRSVRSGPPGRIGLKAKFTNRSGGAGTDRR